MTKANTTRIVLPTIETPFPLSYHVNGDDIAAASDAWFEAGCKNFTAKQRDRLYGLKAGILTAYTYNTAKDTRLRTVCDFMNILFHLDDLSDELTVTDTKLFAKAVMNAFAVPQCYRQVLPDGLQLPKEELNASILCRDMWSRCIQDAGQYVQARFYQNMHNFFDAVEAEAIHRQSNSLPDISTYMILRRDNSGCRPCFDLLEYALDINLPPSVIGHPVIQALADYANDFIALSNDIFSYNTERARGDTYNLVSILMEDSNTDLQGAIKKIGNMCDTTISDFLTAKGKLPSWGDRVDQEVASYIRGLEDWMAGSLHWSFLSKRYFGEKGADVKRNGVVQLLPIRPLQPNVA